MISLTAADPALDPILDVPSIGPMSTADAHAATLDLAWLAPSPRNTSQPTDVTAVADQAVSVRLLIGPFIPFVASGTATVFLTHLHKTHNRKTDATRVA